MTAEIRRLTREEVEGSAFWPLLWEAAGDDSDALMWIREVELPHLFVLGAVDEEVVGFAAFEKTTHTMLVHYLDESESARDQGFAVKLIRAIREFDPSLPVEAIADDDTVEFYVEAGFSVAPAVRDPRWPDRERYLVRIAPLGGAPVDSPPPHG